MAPFASTSRQRASSTSSDDSMTESGQDPVVKRLPVYYTPYYLNSLTLLQYPDRPPRPDTRHPLLPPSLRPDHDPPPRDPTRSTLHAKYKPLTQHLEVKVPIERQRDMYNDDKAKEFAQGVLDDSKDEQGGKKRKKGKQAEDEDERQRREEEKDRRRLDSITYSSASVPDVTNYLVGIVKDDALHLSPVTQTYQLRPSLTYLDNLITLERRRKRDQKDQDDDSEGDISDAEIKKEEAKAVQVSVKQNADTTGGGAFGKMGTGPANGRAGASLFAPLRAEEGEAWIDLKHCHADTPQAEQAFERLFVSDDGANVKLASTTKPSEYLGTTK